MPRTARTKTVREIAAEMLVERRKQTGDQVAVELDHPTGAQPIPSSRERELFWKRSLPPEQELALQQQGLTPSQISAQVFARRWQMARMMFGDDAVKIGEWARRHVRLGPPDQPTPGDTPDAPTAPGPPVGGY
jgi:hypothetical protein